MSDLGFGSSEGLELPTAEQESLLRKSLAQEETRRLVPPVICVSFGLLPLGEHGGALVVAMRPDVPSRALPALQQLVPRPIHAIRFDREAMIKHLMLLNQMEGGINLPTFETPEFMDKPELLERLHHPKVEEGVEPLCELESNEILLFDYRYVSEMTNLDAEDNEETTHYSGSMDVAFRVRDGEAHVFRKEALEDDAVLLTRRQFSLRGTENAVGLGGKVVRRDELPYVVHPSEIQVRGVTPTGIVVHNYDHDQYVGVDAPADFSFGCTYYFLDAGRRQMRRIRIEVFGLWRMRKSELKLLEREEWGDEQDLDRWFYNDRYASLT